MNKLREFLDKNGIKHKKFAELLDTTPFTLHGILNDIRYPTLRLALEIEKKTMGTVTVYDYKPNVQTKIKNKKNAKKKEKKKNNNLNSV